MRVVTATCVGAVLAVAVASSLAWSRQPPPTRIELERTVAELIGDEVALDQVTELNVDSSHLGPQQIRGTLTAPLSLDVAGVEEILANGRRTGWQTTVVRDLDGMFLYVRATRGDLAADISAAPAQVDLATMVPRSVHVSVGVGGFLGGFLGCWLNLRRQRGAETLRGRRWRRAVASGLLPPFAVLTAAIPVYAVLSGSARQVGDYGSLAVGVLVLLAGFWVPVGVLIGAIVWFWPARWTRDRRANGRADQPR